MDTEMPWSEPIRKAPYCQHLRDAEIRVATICAGNWSDPIRCTLSYCNLDWYPIIPYRPLSYVWGSPRVTETIFLDDVPFDVTVNLACAIRYIREELLPVRVWIDAICIDQSNLVERSSQVQSMRRIYASSQGVTVFLGDGLAHRIQKSYWKRPPLEHMIVRNDARDNDMFSKFQQSWESLLNTPTWQPFLVIGLVRMISDPDRYDNLIRKIAESDAVSRGRIFELLRHLLVRPWWYRIWVVQEVAVSPQVTIQYGNFTAPWETFVAAARTCEVHRSKSLRSLSTSDSKVLALLCRQVSEIENLRRRWSVSGGVELLALLREFSSRNAADERDRVFALLGLACQKNLITPDYTIDITEVYRQTVLKLISDHGSLAPLSGNLRRKTTTTLPSWIPDFGSVFHEPDRRRMVLQGVYSACLKWELTIFTSENDYWTHVERQMLVLESELKSLNARIDSRLSGHLRTYAEILLNEERETKNPQVANKMSSISQLCGQLSHLFGTCEGLSSNPSQPTIPIAAFFNQSAAFVISRPKGFMESPLRDGEIELTELFPLARLFKLRPQSKMTGPTEATKTLFIQSKFRGKIIWITPSLVTWTAPDLSWMSIFEWAKWIAAEKPTSYEVAHMAHMKSFLRTLVGGIRRRSSLGFRRLFKEDYRDLVSWFINQLFPRLEDLKSRFRSEDFGWWLEILRRIDISGSYTIRDDLETNDEAPNFDDEMRFATEGRALFFTDQGQMGLAPSSTAVGDEIHVLPSGDSEFVLRPTGSGGDAFEIIGDCFLDEGFATHEMEGEHNICTLKGSLPHEILCSMIRIRGEHLLIRNIELI